MARSILLLLVLAAVVVVVTTATRAVPDLIQPVTDRIHDVVSGGGLGQNIGALR